MKRTFEVTDIAVLIALIVLLLTALFISAPVADYAASDAKTAMEVSDTIKRRSYQ